MNFVHVDVVYCLQNAKNGCKLEDGHWQKPTEKLKRGEMKFHDVVSVFGSNLLSKLFRYGIVNL